jgi:hypothetical protein
MTTMMKSDAKCAPGSVVITEKTTVAPHVWTAIDGSACVGGACPIGRQASAAIGRQASAAIGRQASAPIGRQASAPIRFPAPYPSPLVAPLPHTAFTLYVPTSSPRLPASSLYATGFISATTPTKQASYCAPAACGTARYSNCRFPSHSVVVTAPSGDGCERYISPI